MRKYPQGRIGADDEGECEMAVTLDLRHKVIRIVFKKPIDWIGLDLETARALRDKLSEHIETLEHVRVIE